jgi:hypothetical protein
MCVCVTHDTSWPDFAWSMRIPFLSRFAHIEYGYVSIAPKKHTTLRACVCAFVNVYSHVRVIRLQCLGEYVYTLDMHVYAHTYAHLMRVASLRARTRIHTHTHTHTHV